ncbi:MAG: hypothetical protein WC291_12730 [Thermodesulfovibrionales bacterium]|jgi:GTP cyclohydrolase I
MKKPSENSEEFLSRIREWQALEDKTISSAQTLLNKSNNALVTMTMDMIVKDSAKHKEMLQMIVDNLEKEAVHLTPDELAPLVDLLTSHMEAEAKSIAFADEALEKSELFITQYILSYILADETKHHSLINKLVELKRATIFVT